MDAATRAVLNDAENLLIDETGRDALAGLDEDAAIELETRIRRARNKYVGQYRRSAAARVTEQGGRGAARPENADAMRKAEAFERALAQVSRKVAALARQSAAELRSERLDMARSARQSAWPGSGEMVPRPRSSRSAGRSGPDAPAGEMARRNPATEKARASTMATGDRRQARRDTKRSSAQ